MPMEKLRVGENTRDSYLAVPVSESGKGVLVLHAWWGLNDFFKALCDRLAQEGYVAFAPDLNRGQLATTVQEAQAIDAARPWPDNDSIATANAALAYLQAHPAVRGDKLGAIGFSMGTEYAEGLDEAHPDAFGGIVLFYGGSNADLSKSKASYLGHFAEKDDYEPDLNTIKKLAGPNVEIVIYPLGGHWFFESNRAGDYEPVSAAQAWDRTLAFFAKTL